LTKASFYGVVAAVCLAPVLALSQSSNWPDRMEQAVGFCLQNAGPECDSAVTTVLADLALENSAPQPISDFAAIFAFAADPTLPADVRAAIARALALIANATTDSALRTQILDIAALINSGESLQLEAARLLASPN